MKTFCRHRFESECNDNRPAGMRKGQHLYNQARNLFPDEVDLICSTEDDCFFDDNKINRFMNALMRKIKK